MGTSEIEEIAVCATCDFCHFLSHFSHIYLSLYIYLYRYRYMLIVAIFSLSYLLVVLNINLSDLWIKSLLLLITSCNRTDVCTACLSSYGKIFIKTLTSKLCKLQSWNLTLKWELFIRSVCSENSYNCNTSPHVFELLLKFLTYTWTVSF